MQTLVTPNNNIIETFLKKYRTLPQLYQQILIIRALILQTCDKVELKKHLMAMKITPKSSSIYNSDLDIALKKLVHNKFLDENYSLDSQYIHCLAALATQEQLQTIKSIFITNHDLYFAVINPTLQHYQAIYYAIYSNDEDFFIQHADENTYCCLALVNLVIYLSTIGWSDLSWVETRHPLIQAYLYCARLSVFCINTPTHMTADIELWSASYRQNYKAIISAVTIQGLRRRLFQINICMGILELTPGTNDAWSDDFFCPEEEMGAIAFFAGNMPAAIKYYDSASKKYRRITGDGNWPEKNLHALFYTLALIQQENTNKADGIASDMSSYKDHVAVFYLLRTLVNLKTLDVNDPRCSTTITHRYVKEQKITFPLLLACLAWEDCLLKPQKLKEQLQEHKNNFTKYLAIGHYLATLLYAELVIVADAADVECAAFLSTSPFGAFRFMPLIVIKQAWEQAIDKLGKIVVSQTADLTENRAVWLVDPKTLSLDLLEQKLLKNGTWSKGKTIIYDCCTSTSTRSKLKYLTKQDLAAISGLGTYYYSSSSARTNRSTFNALIGHPLIFHTQNRDMHLELIRGELGLQVEKIADGYHLSLAEHSTEPRIFLLKDTTNRYRVIDFSDEFVAIGQIVSKDGLVVPFDAKEHVINIIRHAKASIPINSDVDDDNIPTIPGDTTCCVHMLQVAGGSMKLNLWIKPFGEHGHYYRAGHGQANVIASIATENGEKTKQKVIRNFTQELASTKHLIKNCSTLKEFDEKSDEWYFDATETCLEALLELEEYKQKHALNIEWPKGETFKLKQKVSYKNLSMSIKGERDWFEYDGEVKLDHGLTLSMKSLLDSFENKQNHGRFVKLADGEFIALTEKFKKHLEDLKAISEGNRVYRLSTEVLRNLADDEVQINGDKTWKAHIKKLQSMEKHNPSTPSTLQATLREYQETGFKYLSRLMHWNIGACLADDMGVGKTVQTIAVLLELAPSGPILIVAPTSVCFNWHEELDKFAPTLNVHTLSDATDRKLMVESLDKMDVLICSYSLLHQTEEAMLSKDWQAVVLDEAQAIKNHNTRRWKCATQLKSQCRIALTGTPVENHLGEIWSIFRFLNPGLLGSLPAFQKRYLFPIEKYNDPVAKRALKNLVCPYILRRTKSEVLQELPAKTEQAILIEPTVEEAAFYEAVRIKAMQRINQLEQDNAGTKRFSILAEIARLRQACCHSSLADPNINLESSKIKTFLNIVRNLIENNHKALVFSQYVRYLDKIKEVLDNEKITYQYLDGATPVKARQIAVNAFQAGDSDLFLISLKAGGSGLNLSAADYVIILDPWWNPAVEEQAAARAHRIGQLRPVTVYRLIMQNSIEEKIIALHKNKKDIADDLLSGSDVSGKITEEELMQLMSI